MAKPLPQHERVMTAIWRMESPKVIATLARMLRQVAMAEEFAQDAWVAALEQWPVQGMPDNPGAWLMTTAKRRALDELRRRKVVERGQAALAHDPDLIGSAEGVEASADAIDDDLLRLMFVACHPALGCEARAALTLRLLGGLTPAEIARARAVAPVTPTN